MKQWDVSYGYKYLILIIYYSNASDGICIIAREEGEEWFVYSLNSAYNVFFENEITRKGLTATFCLKKKLICSRTIDIVDNAGIASEEGEEWFVIFLVINFKKSLIRVN